MKNGFLRKAQMLFDFLSGPANPVTLKRFGAKNPRRAVSDLLNAGKRSAEDGRRYYDALVYDGLHTAFHSGFRGRYIKPFGSPALIYRAHNREAAIWSRMAEQEGNFILSSFLKHQAACVKRFEDSLVEAASAVMAVSEPDFNEFNRVVKRLRGGVVPIGMSFEDPPPWPKEEVNHLLFLGRLDWPPNKDGLKWFLREVWPLVSKQRKDLRLTIAGSGDAAWLRPLLPIKGANFLGYAPDISQLYAQAVVCLVPVFYGSGTRVKAIEACRYARPCLGTAVGMEGVGLTPGKEYFAAESREEWIRTLTCFDLSLACQVGKAAYHKARESFGLEKSARAFIDYLRPAL